MLIRAAVARAGVEEFLLETIHLEEPRPDEVLIKIMACGICHTDLVAKSRPLLRLPAVLGHEGAGIVEKVGPLVRKVVPGDHVVVSFLSCGSCARCHAGLPSYCARMPQLNFTGARADGSRSLQAVDGPVASHFFGQSSFATHCVATERNVVRVPKDLPLEILAPLGCGVQTGAGSITRSLACESGSSLLVLGGGAVGLSAVLGATLQGCSPIIVVEPHARRRNLAMEFGATLTIDPMLAPDLSASVKAILPDGVDYAFDTTGIPALQHSGLECLACAGTLGVVGISPPGTPIPGEISQLVRRGLSIKGIVEGDADPDTFIPQMIEWYREGRFPFDRMIRTHPFSRINEAIAYQRRGECVKMVLLMGE